MLVYSPFRWWILLGLVLTICQSAGCSSKEPRYPEDHMRFLRIDTAVETLRKAYVEKNFSDMKNLMLPFDRLERLGKEIQRDFLTFQDIELEFSIDRITIDGETVDVFVHWQGHWRQEPMDAGIRERGLGMLRWVGVRSILLKDVEGDLPFGMANRLTLSEPRPAIVR